MPTSHLSIQMASIQMKPFEYAQGVQPKQQQHMPTSHVRGWQIFYKENYCRPCSLTGYILLYEIEIQEEKNE